MSKRDIVLTNVTVVQLLRQPCPGEGGGNGRKGGQEPPQPRTPCGARARRPVPTREGAGGGVHLFHRGAASLRPYALRRWPTGFYRDGGGPSSGPHWAWRSQRAVEGWKPGPRRAPEPRLRGRICENGRRLLKTSASWVSRRTDAPVGQR